jgi:LacI family transcriptional regulator
MKKNIRTKATVHDVALKAGVSIATVSRAFSLPDVVKTEVREHVLNVAQKMGYSPNPAAKALRLRKTHIVGAVIPTLDYAIFARMINTFQEALATFDYITIVLTTGFDNSSVYDKAKLLIDRGAEALLVVGAIEDKAFEKFIRSSAVPVVSTYSFLKDGVVPCIGFDNYAATTSIMDYLVSLGHQKFAMIAGSPKGNDRQRHRIQAYVDCLAKNRLDGAQRVIKRPFSIEDGAQAMHEIHQLHPEVTAVVCNTDIFAFGALSECRKIGLTVPKDISIVGFDDADYSSRLDPPLTTIAVPAEEMGRNAAIALHAALTGKKKLHSEMLETTIKVRASATKPPKSS